MTVVIAGGHGKIGLQLGRLLAPGGLAVRGIIRNPDHAVELEAAGVSRRCATLRARPAS